VTLTFDVPEEVWQAIDLPMAEAQAEVRKEVAIALFRRGLISLGKASESSGLPRPEFEEALAQRRVERPYDAMELDRDLDWAKSGV
jgi:predicted HTH domain antitoxin